MLDDQRVAQLRGPKADVDPAVPYLYLNEKEPDSTGGICSVNTIFLTNKECPFKCIMCDLWKHTLDEPTPAGAIPRQIEYALKRLPEASVVKLYNSGNFFDLKAVPGNDYSAIAALLSSYRRVIVENHPTLCGKNTLKFNELIKGTFEVALGLESIHPEVLPKLNKQITRSDYIRAAGFLTEHGIDIRTFVLLNPPFLTDAKENMEWTLKTVEFAFSHGSGSCSIIPTRAGNGVMDHLQKEGTYVPPTLDALEEVFDLALNLNKGRVFADLWDLNKFASCPDCFEARKKRLQAMNLQQTIHPRITCSCGNHHG